MGEQIDTWTHAYDSRRNLIFIAVARSEKTPIPVREKLGTVDESLEQRGSPDTYYLRDLLVPLP